MTALNPTNNFVEEMNMKAVIDTNAQKLWQEIDFITSTTTVI